jgi:Fe-S cluster assembly ATP-binding protein
MTIMGFPKYRVTKGRIIFKGQDITMLPLDERARLGIGMSFQRPPVVRGVKTRDMVATCLRGREQEESISQIAEQANLADFLDREINYGFSGGEIKRSELMQLLAQNPL